MRKLIICILCFFFIEYSSAQEIVWPVDVEIYLIIQGLIEGEEVGFRMTAESSVWELVVQPESWDFVGPSHLYDEVFYPEYSSIMCITLPNTPLPWNSAQTKGYNIICGSNSWNQPSIGHGLYRLEIYNLYCEYYVMPQKEMEFPKLV